MKKIITMLLIAVMCLSLVACGGTTEKEPQAAEFDSVVTDGNFEITVSSDILVAEQLNGDKDQNEEFLTTDMTNYGDSVLCDVTIVPIGDNSLVVVDYTIKNISKESATFRDVVTLDYNNGYTYKAEEQYYITDDYIDDWHQFTKSDTTTLKLDPLREVMCKAQLTVPTEVFTNESAPLKLILGNYVYTIR